MSWFVVGDFHDNTTRLLCPLEGYETDDRAKERIQEILVPQLKPHHVSYRTVESNSWRELERDGVKI